MSTTKCLKVPRIPLFLLAMCIFLGHLNGQTTVTWTQRAALGPIARDTSAMVFRTNSGTCLLFGGWDGAKVLADTWEWNGQTWRQMSPGTSPPARKFHAMAYDAARDRVVLFGGWDNQNWNQPMGDTWEWDGQNWIQCFPATKPGPRFTHAMAFDALRGRVVLFGGWSGTTQLADTWEWDGQAWVQRSPSASPPARDTHALTFHEESGRTLLFGGWDGANLLGDTWEWDGLAWIKASPASSPSPRRCHAMTYDPNRCRVILFGGGLIGTTNPGFMDETWEWNGAEWIRRHATTSPSPRKYHVMAYDNTRERTIVFGGWGWSGLTADTWVMAQPWFLQDVTSSNMPAAGHLVEDLVLGDLNGDKLPDLVVGTIGLFSGGGAQNRIFFNDGKGGFVDQTAGNLPVFLDDCNAVVLVDVDRDGDLDIICGTSLGLRLYLNNGKGVFSDATSLKLPPISGNVQAIAWGDFDKDGWPDLVLGLNSLFGEQPRLLLNNKAGAFTDVTATKFPTILHGTRAIAIGDVDGDGDLDIVLGGAGVLPIYSQTRLLINDGRGLFTDATKTNVPVESDQTASLLLLDIDGDGDLDLVLGNMEGQNRIFVNNGKGVFADQTQSRLPIFHDRTMSLAAADMNRDGHVDLIFGNGTNAIFFNLPERDRILLNDGSGRFEEVTPWAFPQGLRSTHALAAGDVDGDGLPDLVLGFTKDRFFATPPDPVSLYRNRGSVHKATLTPFGQGCKGSLGKIPVFSSPGLPRLGQTFQLSLTDALPLTASLIFFDIAGTSVGLGPFGAPGCTAYVNLHLLHIVVPTSLTGTWYPMPSLKVPYDLALLGGAIYFQAFVVDPAANRLGVVSSNGLMGVVGF